MIQDHILSGVHFLQTPNISGQRITPRFLVIHYTGSGTFDGAVQTLTDNASKRSAHIVIGREGQVVQLARFDQRAWHAGLSEWKGMVDMNSRAIGIELENWGPITSDKDGLFRSWAGTLVDPAEVTGLMPHKNGGPEKYWHRYTSGQLEICKAIARELVAHYGLEDVLGHDDIAPTRKIDPGPAFPMEELRAHCFSKPAYTTEALKARAVHFEPTQGGVMVTVTDREGDTAAILTDDEARWLYTWLAEKYESCTCDEGYTSRKLKDPNCRKHS